MSKIPAVTDYANPSLILDSLRAVGRFLRDSLEEAAAQECSSLPDDAYKSAAESLHLLARYLQYDAPEAQKNQLGDSIATDPDVIDCLYEGILIPFIQELSSGIKEISGVYRLQVVKLIQVCLMEWTSSIAMREKLVKCGCVNLMFTELRNLTLNTHLGSNQFAQHLIQTAALIISNCLSDDVDLFVRLHPHVDVQAALTPYFECPNSLVPLVCKLTYYHFSFYLHQRNPGSIDCLDDLTKYIRLLCTASENPEFVAREGKLFLCATDLLKVIRQMCVSESNCLAVVSMDSFHESTLKLLQNGGEKEVKSTLDLLLSLTACRKYSTEKEKYKEGGNENPEQVPVDVREMLLGRNPKLVHAIKAVRAGSHGTAEEVLELSSALLWSMEKNTTPEWDTSCLEYIKCCYKYGYYEESCYWVDHICKSSLGDKAQAVDPFLLYKGKSLFCIYQRMQVLFCVSEKYIQNVAELNRKREKVYLNAKEVIKILGVLEAKQVFDNESNRFFDIALMDYIRELNKPPDIKLKHEGHRIGVFYCMLCHKKEQILRSHVVPEAVLRAIFKGDDQLFMMGPAGLPATYRSRTFKTQTLYMLCSKCDNVTLSRDELLFIKAVARPIYDASLPRRRVEKVDGIAYDEWLYRFCCGVLFRGMALGRGITASINEEEVYRLFEQCRAVLQSPKTSDVHPDLLPIIAMFFTPGIVEEQSCASATEKPSNLVRALNDNIFFKLANVPLSGTTPSAIRNRHFFVAHFGIFTIVAPFGPLPSEFKPFVIDPCSGVLGVPANNDRLRLNPPGLQTVYEEQSEKAVKYYIEKTVEEDKKKREINILLVNTDSATMSFGTPSTFNLLPQGFVVNRDLNIVAVKQGHQVLLHLTHQPDVSSSDGHSLFLAADVTAPANPYVIIHSFAKALQTMGFFIDPFDFAFKGELDQSHNAMMKALRAKDLGLFKAPNRLMPISFERAGLCNYQSLLLHFKRTSTVDTKCISGDGCWYCSSKCVICMQESKPAYSIQREVNLRPKLRFCGEECKSFSGPPEVFAQYHKPAVSTPLAKVDFLFLSSSDNSEVQVSVTNSTHLLHMSLPYCEFTPFLAVIDVYRAGYLFTLFHLKNIEEQVFGEFYLTEEFKLSKPLPHINKDLDERLIELVNELLQSGIKMSSHDVHGLLSMGSTKEPKPVDPAKQSNGSGKGKDEGLTGDLGLGLLEL